MDSTATLVSRQPVPVGVDAGLAVATGALTLVDPGRLGPFGRLALRSGQAAVVGGLVWSGAARDDELRWQPELRVAQVAGAVAATFAVAELGEMSDAALARALRRRGVRRPRLLMAIASAGLTFGLSLLERRHDAGGAPAEDETVPVDRPLPPRVREIVAALLEATEDYDSLRLRAQLAVAREQLWGDEGGFSRMLEFTVPDDVPLAVPHSFVFPVAGHFHTRRGVPCQLQLHVDGGRLARVIVEVGAEWDEIADVWDDGGGDPDPLGDVLDWPRVEELGLVAETAGRPENRAGETG